MCKGVKYKSYYKSYYNKNANNREIIITNNALLIWVVN